jgi:hypothetical protein
LSARNYPAPILRSRDIRHFKGDEITVLKDFESVLVEVRIEYKQGSAFRISVAQKKRVASSLRRACA